MSGNRTLIHMGIDSEFTRALVECLVGRGINVVSVETPALLIAELKTCQHRVVVFDIDFPGIDGLELLREIKRYDGCTQVIGLTSIDVVALLIQSYQDGAEACFLKPAATMESIVAAVEDVFQKIDRWWDCLRDVVKYKQTRGAVPPHESMEGRTLAGMMNAADDSQKCPASNRRQWTRYPTQGKQITVVTDRSQQAAVVVDESFGGIGLLMDNPVPVSVGGEITLVYRGVPMRGIVRRIQTEEDGRFLAGIEWLKTPPGSTRDAHGAVQ